MTTKPHSLTSSGETLSFTAPRHACDAHFHVFGPPEHYPYRVPNMRYDPPMVSIEEYQALMRPLGIERMVLIQPSCYRYDNDCQLDAVAALGTDSARAVVDIDENATDAELQALHERGARGVRINVNPIEPVTPGLGQSILPRVKRIEERCKELGWHLDFLFPDWLTEEFMPELRRLEVPYSLAHIGMNRGENGIATSGFQSLLETLQHGNGRCWVKLTAAYRISNLDDYADVVPLAQSVIDAAPDHVLWGSDFPHVSFTQHSTVGLFDLLARFAPDEELRNRILVDNPEAFYGFPSTH